MFFEERLTSYQSKCKTNLTVKEYEYMAKRKKNIELIYSSKYR